MLPHRRSYATALAAVLLALGSAVSGCSDSGGTPEQASPVKVPPLESLSPTSPSARTTATYTASRKGSGTPSAEEMRITAERLRKRATSLGLKGADVRVDGTVITIVAPGGDADPLRRMAATALLEFRPVLEPAGAGKSGLKKAYDSLVCDHSTTAAPSRPDHPTVACDRQSGQKYLLGPTAVSGTDVESASPEFDTANGNGWLVNLAFSSTGSSTFARVTGTLAQQLPPANQFAIVIDGDVVSAPAVASAITGGKAQISGNFTQDLAANLAAVISSGALPVQLTVGEISTKP